MKLSKSMFLHLAYLMSIVLLLWGCNGTKLTEPVNDDNSSQLNLNKVTVVNWTVTATFEFECSDQITNFGYSDLGDDFMTILQSHNGVAPGNYLCNTRMGSTTYNYPFPNGVSQFKTGPSFSYSHNIPEATPRYLNSGGTYSIPNIGGASYITKTVAYPRFKILWVKNSVSTGQSINKWYTKNLNSISVSVTFTGPVENSQSGSGDGSFCIHTGMSNLSLNDIDLTVNDNSPNHEILILNKHINGEYICGNVIITETPPPSED